MKLDFNALSAQHPAASTTTAPMLRDIALSIDGAEQIAIIGPSGAGKTSLLQVMACAIKPVAGSCVINGIKPWELSRAQLQKFRSKIFLAPQVPPLPPRQRVVTAVLAGRLPLMGLWASLCSLMYPADAALVQTTLARFDLAEKLFERVDRLSAGERQRVGLARALVSPASLWLIDEPLSALDPRRSEQALGVLIDEARARGVTLVTSLHQVEIALAKFSRIIGIRSGEIFFDLPTVEVTPALLEQLYAHQENEATPSVPQTPSAMRAPLPC